MSWKYLILRVKTPSKNSPSSEPLQMDLPMIFPELLVHSDVLAMTYQLTKMTGLEVVGVRSGGFLDFENVACSGKSESMDVSSGAGDASLIELFNYSKGIVGAMTPEMEKRLTDMLRKKRIDDLLSSPDPS